MPSYPLNNITAPDNQPTPASTLDLLPICNHVNIDLSNSAIYWSVKEARGPVIGLETQGDWQPYVFMIPGSRTIYSRGAGIIGFKFYAAVATASLPVGQQQAQVTVEVVQ